MYVNEIMTRPVITCHGNATLDEVSRQMWENDCGAVPVVNEAGVPVGIVTDRDIAMSAMLNHRPLWEIHAATVVQTQRLVCCGQFDTVEDCLARMEQVGVRRLPVVDAEGKLVGIVSTADAVALTQNGGRRKEGRVSVDNLLGMLRKVATPRGNSLPPIPPVTPA
ncbi:MAG: CBS domain-containing protein [Gammaproteobacteria bacterium]